MKFHNVLKLPNVNLSHVGRGLSRGVSTGVNAFQNLEKNQLSILGGGVKNLFGGSFGIIIVVVALGAVFILFRK